jgi:hypothetical protein
VSYSAIYEVYKTTANELNEYRNGHGTASVLWNLLGVKHLGLQPHGYMFGPALDKLWKLARDPAVPMHLRICHAFTFDDAYVAHENLAILAKACDMTGSDLDAFSPDSVNHWHTLSEDLMRVKKKPKMLGVGLTCTSVSETWPQRIQANMANPWEIFAHGELGLS